jgi:hypothetical protein
MKRLSSAIVNKSSVRIAVLLILISILAGTQIVKVAEANPIPWCFNPVMTITIQSPENETINSLPVSVSFTSQGDWQFSVSDDSTQSWVRSFFYVLDGQDMGTSGVRFASTKTTTISEQGSRYSYNFNGQAYLTNLTDGPHSITVYYGAVNNISYVGSPQERIIYNTAWQATSQFYVQSKLTPSPAPTQTPSPIPTTNPSTSSNPILASNFLSNKIFLIAVLSIVGLFAVIAAVIVYKRVKTRTIG